MSVILQFLINTHFYLGHLRLALSSQKAQIVDFILNHKVLLFPLEVLGSQDKEESSIRKDILLINVIIMIGSRSDGETYMGLAPKDEDLSHHPEELSGDCIRLLQPPGPEMDNNMDQGQFLPSDIRLC